MSADVKGGHTRATELLLENILAEVFAAGAVWGERASNSPGSAVACFAARDAILALPILSAAPDLLEALKDLLESFTADLGVAPLIGSDNPHEHAAGLAAAAILKAEGPSS